VLPPSRISEARFSVSLVTVTGGPGLHRRVGRVRPHQVQALFALLITQTGWGVNRLMWKIMVVSFCL